MNEKKERILKKKFFEREPDEVAKELPGKKFVRKIKDKSQLPAFAGTSFVLSF